MLIVGAGSMSALAAATAARSGAASIVVANRTRKHAERLAASVSTTVTKITGLAGLPAAMAAADILISCTGAAGRSSRTTWCPPRSRRGRRRARW